MYEIFKITSEVPVDFAATELQKYLRMMMPRCGAVPIKYNPDAKGGIRLGLMQDFGIDVSEAQDTYLDDIIHLEKSGDGQIIAGSNPRSVLLAVYKFLKLNGCRWLFPGVDGEFIPLKEVQYVNYHKMADNRYRGQCNEGSTAQENYMDIIDFIPKIGMNIYMQEFDIPSGYYNKWYKHEFNPALPDETLTDEQVLQWKRQCDCEISKRGLQCHDIGHGWNSAAFGVKSTSTWTPDGIDVPEKFRENVAMLGGKREFFKGIILDTNFCMSKKTARKLIIDNICDYAQLHNYVDFLHVWLADGRDNHCECEECVKKDASDWYVIFLNELDEELTSRGISTHIAFIAYYDTFYPPVAEKIKNCKRFSMLFAPHTRVYTESYLEDADDTDYVPYIRNANVVPKGIAVNMAYLDRWKKAYTGDVFCYEYHFWRMQTYEPTYQYLAHNIYDDIHGLKKHGLNGIIEDQTPRNFLPSGLAQTVYGEALFDLSLTFEEIEEDYMSHAFGKNHKKVTDFLNSICDVEIFKALSQNAYQPSKDTKLNFSFPELLPRLEEIKKLCDEFKATVDENQHLPVRCQTVLWRNLYFYLDFIKFYADILKKRFTEDIRGSYDALLTALRALGPKELELQKLFDLDLFGFTLRVLTNPGKKFVDVP